MLNQIKEWKKNITEERLLSTIFLIGAIAAGLMWILNYIDGMLTHFDFYDLLLQIGVLLFSSYGLAKYPHKKNLFLFATYSALCWHMHASWTLALFFYGDNAYYILSLLSLFFPAVYLTAHFFFKEKGTKIALLNFLIMAITSLMALSKISNKQEYQFILANIMSQPVYIVALHFIILMRKKTTQAELLQKDLKEKLEKDNLTGIANRLFLSNFFTEDQIMLENNKINEIAMLMIDIDFFKRINDTLGHSIGDVVLKSVALELKSITRQKDHIIRWGGEEFVMLVNTSNKADLENITQRILKEVQKVSPGGNLPNVTVSIGVAYRKNKESAKQLLDFADQALYESKSQGRNRATFYVEK